MRPTKPLPSAPPFFLSVLRVPPISFLRHLLSSHSLLSLRPRIILSLGNHRTMACALRAAGGKMTIATGYCLHVLSIPWHTEYVPSRNHTAPFAHRIGKAFRQSAAGASPRIESHVEDPTARRRPLAFHIPRNAAPCNAVCRCLSTIYRERSGRNPPLRFVPFSISPPPFLQCETPRLVSPRFSGYAPYGSSIAKKLLEYFRTSPLVGNNRPPRPVPAVPWPGPRIGDLFSPNSFRPPVFLA